MKHLTEEELDELTDEQLESMADYYDSLEVE